MSGGISENKYKIILFVTLSYHCGSLTSIDTNNDTAQLTISSNDTTIQQLMNETITTTDTNNDTDRPKISSNDTELMDKLSNIKEILSNVTIINNYTDTTVISPTFRLAEHSEMMNASEISPLYTTTKPTLTGSKRTPSDTIPTRTDSNRAKTKKWGQWWSKYYQTMSDKYLWFKSKVKKEVGRTVQQAKEISNKMFNKYKKRESATPK